MADEWMWVDIGDDRECPDCVELGGQVDTWENWTASGLPRERGTICDGDCRCMMMTTDITKDELQKQIDDAVDEAVNEMLGGIKFDLRSGKTLLLNDFDQITGIDSLPYYRVDELENKIYKWKYKTGESRPLPKTFFELADVDKMIEWLDGEL